MSNSPIVSVIIPVYNVEKYLARCINSVLAQTFNNFEILCVNDGSTDTCGQILEEFAKKDLRIKIITQANQGVSVARNNGLKAAQGEFIYFLDSDDFIHPQLLEINLYFLRKYNADCATFRYDKSAHKASTDNPENFTYSAPLYKAIENISFKITENPLKLFRKNLSYKMTYYIWARLYRKDLLKGIEFIPNIRFEDDPFIMAVCAKHPKTVLLNEPLYYYVNNNSSVSNTTKASITAEHLEYFSQGSLYIYNRYKNASKKDFKFIAKVIIPRRLRIQYKKIKKAGFTEQTELYTIFAKELANLEKKGFLPFSLNLRNLFYWLKYKKLIKELK